MDLYSVPHFTDGSIKRGIKTEENESKIHKRQKIPEDTSTECAGRPPAWAQTRQDLCETLPWFKTYQGGIYSSIEKGCLGLLLDESCGDRAYIDEEIIITHVSGGYMKDDQQNLVLKKSQTLERGTNNALLRSFEAKKPFGVIIGDKNKALGRQLPHRYNVMDIFRITHMWAEKMGEYTGYMMRLQKVDLASKSWWAAKDSPDPPIIRDFQTRPASIMCTSCQHSSCIVYKDVWMCLNKNCQAFWKVNGAAPTTALEYDPVFLSHRSNFEEEYSLDSEKFVLIPPPPVITADNLNIYRLGVHARQGIVCPLCAKCVARVFWDGWKCSVKHHTGPQPRSNEPKCPFNLIIHGPPISLWDVVPAPYSSPMERSRSLDDPTSLAPYRKLKYSLGEIGTITHLVSNLAINARDNGPDDLFQRFQGLNLDLRRERLQMSPVVGMMTGHFLMNIGLPYKFVVPVQSKPFGETDPQILLAHSRLVWATGVVAAESHHEYQRPNELLLVGYKHDMDMGYHDDGEFGLGPTIATLSLGASSTMFIRMKGKYYSGLQKNGNLLKEDPVLPGCDQYDARKGLRDQFRQGIITEKQYDEERLKILDKYKAPPPIIKMETHHGHLIVMHGDSLQKYYEHRVEPQGDLRFAITARHIRENMVDPRHLYMGRYTLPPGLAYNGQ
ncbi:hypothetical protein PENSTE_c008G01386 [Penicillium steckii]|uniref:Fe2OG dioxygenase domain-containing protein n=1 Tax=Penicillium steckii TaxID=303698 RepID=A0A1V6TC07_9EURO|nr:hypothetical protein PENSTE_c008G01386 [Penicillium steckii]